RPIPTWSGRRGYRADTRSAPTAGGHFGRTQGPRLRLADTLGGHKVRAYGWRTLWADTRSAPTAGGHAQRVWPRQSRWPAVRPTAGTARRGAATGRPVRSRGRRLPRR